MQWNAVAVVVVVCYFTREMMQWSADVVVFCVILLEK